MYPPSEHSWAGKVTFSLSYPHAGWITLGINCTAFIQSVFVDCSDAFDPFPNFIEWLENLSDNNLPCEFSIDEEGRGKTFRAVPINDDEFLFTMTPMYWKPRDNETEEPLFLYAVASRKQVVSEFLKRWDDFIADQWDANEWRFRDLSLLDVSRLREFVEA
jgi:hypothetical protein